jgi:N6-adenosine-specific RNA methylase IME4
MSTDTKCGPETCPLTAWTALSPSERKVQRQPLARKLHEQGFTPEAIAEQFGLHVATIYRDLEFSHDAKIKPAKTASNPKGAGRPKGSTKGGNKHGTSKGRKSKQHLRLVSSSPPPVAGRKYKSIVVDTSSPDLAALSAWADADCVLWVWLPEPDQPWIRSALDVMDRLGFREVGLLSWLKESKSGGRHYASEVEHCLVLSRGSIFTFRFPKKAAFTGGAQEGWSRPLEFYMLVGHALPTLRQFLEIGGHGPTRPFWDRDEQRVVEPTQSRDTATKAARAGAL